MWTPYAQGLDLLPLCQSPCHHQDLDDNCHHFLNHHMVAHCHAELSVAERLFESVEAGFSSAVAQPLSFSFLLLSFSF